MKTFGLLIIFFLLQQVTAVYPQARAPVDDDEWRALRDEFTPQNTQDGSFEKFQESLQNILSQRRFQRERNENNESAQPRAEEYKKSNRKRKFWHRERSLNILSFLIMLIGIAALVAIAIFFLKGIRANLIVDAEDTSTALDEQHPGTAKDALDKAHELEKHSDFRGAIRALYLAALLYLHEHSLLTYDKSLTNREYLRTLKEQPMMHEAFQPVVHIFDDVWYGYKPCTAETLSEYRGMVQKLKEGQEG